VAQNPAGKSSFVKGGEGQGRKAAIAEQQKFSALLKMLRAGLT
jgi:hypothetical protein